MIKKNLLDKKIFRTICFPLRIIRETHVTENASYRLWNKETKIPHFTIHNIQPYR